MFKIFIAEPILKTIIEDESKKAEASRSFLYNVFIRCIIIASCHS